MTIEALEAGLVLPVDKPYGWSSFQVVNKLKWDLRRALGVKKFKIGHAGTLDPLATGLLLVCVGKATKRIEELQAGEKVYSGTLVLGATTPCYDLERPIDAYYPTGHLTPTLVEKTIGEHFLGAIEQVPPVYSAVKVAGQRAYRYARDGQPAEIEPKRVEVYDFEVSGFRHFDPPMTMEGQPLPCPVAEGERQLYRQPQSYPAGLPQVDFRIRCGKGTYIRSLARDLGLALGTGGFLASLRRERVGSYTLDGAQRLV